MMPVAGVRRLVVERHGGRTMREKDCDRPVAPSAAGSVLLVTLFLGAATSLSAQPMPSNSFGPSSPVPNGTYPGYLPTSQPPVQQAQNTYYGNYQNNTVPGYIYPRPYQMPANTGYSGNGITYYYVNNPNGPNYYPFTSPYGTPPAYQAKTRAPTYPIPANTPPAKTPIEEDLGD